MNDERLVQQIKKIFAFNLSKGHTPDIVIEFLLTKKFPMAMVEVAFQEYLAEEAQKILPDVQERVSQGCTAPDVKKILHDKGIPKIVIEEALKKAA